MTDRAYRRQEPTLNLRTLTRALVSLCLLTASLIQAVPQALPNASGNELPVDRSALAIPRTDANSQKAHLERLNKARTGRIAIYFEGDSITRRWSASEPQYKDLLDNWTQNFSGWDAADFGWGGDTVENILWRLDNGELDDVHPKIIVLMAGTNNLTSPGAPDAKVDEVDRGIRAILNIMEKKAPEAVILLMGITPREDRRGQSTGPIIARINQRLAGFADGKKVRFLNINNRLTDSAGKLLEGVTMDGLHLSVKGYQIWADTLKPIFTELLGLRYFGTASPLPSSK